MSIIHSGIYLHTDKDGATLPVMVEISVDDAKLAEIAQRKTDTYNNIGTRKRVTAEGRSYESLHNVPVTVTCYPANQPHDHEHKTTIARFASL